MRRILFVVLIALLSGCSTQLFNEWIVERGSAKVQEKHIALFKDQLALADKKLLVSETEKAEIAATLHLP